MAVYVHGGSRSCCNCPLQPGLPGQSAHPSPPRPPPTHPASPPRHPAARLAPTRPRLPQGTAARRYWSCPGTADLRVRGKGYLADKKKVAAAMPMFDLYSAELVEVDEPMWHMARFLPSVK